MNRLRWRSIISGIIKVSWIMMLVSLPFTSFPYLPPAIGGGALVRPFSIYPLIILMVLMTIPRMWRRPIPRTVLIVIPFILASLLSGMISLLRGIDPSVRDHCVRANNPLVNNDWHRIFVLLDDQPDAAHARRFERNLALDLCRNGHCARLGFITGGLRASLE